MFKASLKNKWLTALANIAVLAVLICAVRTAWLVYHQQGLDVDKIFAESMLKEKSFTKMPVEIKTPLGINFWLIEDHTVPIVAVSFIFERAGRAYDPDKKTGRALIAANMLVYGAGSRDRQDFQEMLELNGIRMGFSAGREDLSGMVITPTVNQSTAFTLLRDALTSPRFDLADLRVEQTQSAEALQIQQENPSSVLNLAFAKEIFGAEHPFARNPLGKEEDIFNLTAEDLYDWLKSSLAKDVLIIGVAGDITPEAAASAVDGIFAALPEHNANKDIQSPDIKFEPRVKHLERDTAQTIAVFAAAGTERFAPDFYPLYMANHVFGGSGLTSRLSLKAREKEGLTYGIYTYLSTDEKTPLILGQFSATPENYPLLQKILQEEWQAFARNGLTPEELETARNYLLASYNLRFDSVAGLADMLTAMQKYRLGLDFLQKRNDYVRAVTLEQVNAAAAKYFSVQPVEMHIGQGNNMAKDD